MCLLRDLYALHSLLSWTGNIRKYKAVREEEEPRAKGIKTKIENKLEEKSDQT